MRRFATYLWNAPHCLRRSVYVSVCLKNISKSYERISMKFLAKFGRGPRRNRLNFAGYLRTLWILDSLALALGEDVI